MSVAVTRGLLALLVFCSLSQLGSAQTEYEFQVGGVNFKVVVPATDNENPAGLCQPAGYNLAVFEDVTEYKAVLAAMATASVPSTAGGYKYFIGINKIAGDRYMRTTGGRPAPIVNFNADYNLADAECVAMSYDTSDSTETAYEQSRWVLDECDVDGLASNEGVICMERTDPSCALSNDCFGDISFQRDNVNKDYCFWNPNPKNIFTHFMAHAMCSEGGGSLMNLYDEADIALLASLVDEKQDYNNYWTGLAQKAKQGTPHWTNGELIDLSSLYVMDPFMYGSSLMLTTYAGIYNARTKKINLWNTAPVDTSQRFNREAFVLCEAEEDLFCVAHAPEVHYALKTVEVGDRLVYTCKDGFVVAPEEGDVNFSYATAETKQYFDCTCNPTFMKNLVVKKCILKNPCHDDPCHAHSYCVFTNSYYKPHYCMCKKGYRMGSDGRCIDINECIESRPCGSYYGSCYNTEGSYFCQCTKGYGWDNGKCSVQGPPGVTTMTLYFHVSMAFTSDMNDPNSDTYKAIWDALSNVVQYTYGDRANLESFYISVPSSGSLKIKMVLSLYSLADIKELSHLAYQFYTYTRSSPSFRVGTNTYPYLPGVYFESPSVPGQIHIETICSIYSDLNYCHGSPCSAQGEYPVCDCRYGYEGDYCDHEALQPTPPPLIHYLRTVDIGIIVCVVILFILVICMPIIVVCCCIPLRRPYPPVAGPHVHTQDYYSHGGIVAAPRKFYGFRRPRMY